MIVVLDSSVSGSMEKLPETMYIRRRFEVSTLMRNSTSRLEVRALRSQIIQRGLDIYAILYDRIEKHLRSSCLTVSTGFGALTSAAQQLANEAVREPSIGSRWSYAILTSSSTLSSLATRLRRTFRVHRFVLFGGTLYSKRPLTITPLLGCCQRPETEIVHLHHGLRNVLDLR